ncbi:MAG: insulinase family protein, partial [Elusimicrobia bacterium]|nr:insulinase family protein [Elusimicrobiota bacterium]
MNKYRIIHQTESRLISELDNRLIIIAERMPAAPVASAQIWVKTGSVFEQEFSGSGISHFLEHLLCGGTTSTRSEAESNKILGKIGAQKNAATGLDTVRYYINTVSSNINTAVELLSDWIINASIPEDEFLREKEVIISEFSMGEGEPGRILWKLTHQALYSSHPARHPTIGYIDEFLKITRDDILSFYKRMYLPNNMVFVVSGDIDPEKITSLIADLWNQIPAGELPEIVFPKNSPEVSSLPIEGKADIGRPQIRLAWPGTSLGAKHDYALDLLGVILGQGDYSRLNRKLRDSERIVSSIRAYNLSFPWGEGFFGIDAEPAPHPEGWESSIKVAKSAILREIKLILKEGLNDEELERAKRMVLSTAFSSNQKVQESASNLASNTIDSSDPDYVFNYASQIQALEEKDLLNAAKKFLDSDNPLEIRLVPLADDEEIEPLERVSTEDIKDNSDHRKIILDNIATIKTLKNAEVKERGRGKIGDFEYHSLSNKIKVILQQSDVVPAASIQIYVKGGIFADPQGQEGIGSALASMLKRGTQNYTAEEFAKTLEGMGAALSAANGYNTFYITGQALSEDFPKLIEMTAEAYLRPTFPEEEWETMKARIEAALARETDSWYGEL